MGDRVQAVERALLLLEEVAASDVPPTAPEIARRAGVNRATAWRLLSTLEHFDLVQRDRHSGRYSVSYGVVRLAATSDTAVLVRRARPVLERLAADTEGTASLEVASRGRLVLLDEARPATPVQIDLSGLVVPLHCGSAGKLYLASLPEPEQARYLAGGLERRTPYTVVEPEQLREQLAACRAGGVATNYKEHQEGWCAITAAVRDRAGRDLAYVGVTLPTYRWTRDALLALAGPLRAAAGQVADRLRPAAAVG